MKTDDLIALLSADAAPVDPRRAGRRFDARLALAPLLALGLVLLFLGPRPDLAAAAMQPMFWLKLAMPAGVAGVAWLLLRRLGHPGAPLGRLPGTAAVPIVAMWLLAAVVLLQAPAADRLSLVLGSTWRDCALHIALLALPALAFAFAAARQLAPTRLRLAGAVAGLFAGAAGAFAYAFHCPEVQAPFLAVWYVAGMLLPAALGALLGRSWLRW